MRWVRILGFVSMTTLSMGCTPSTFWATTTPPGRDFVERIGECGPDEARVCINRCRPIALENGECVVDPCSPEGEIGVCDWKYDCVPYPDRPGLGTCKPLTAYVCNPDLPREGDNRCSAGLVCLKHSCPGVPTTRGEGLCQPYVREGLPCTEDCKCEAGTVCGPALSGAGRVCRRLCTGVGGECRTGDFCVSFDSSLRLCNPCTPNRSALAEGGACCAGLFLQGGICTCTRAGEAPTAGGGCCAHLSLRDGICTARCDPRREPCYPARGECAAKYAESCFPD